MVVLKFQDKFVSLCIFRVIALQFWNMLKSVIKIQYSHTNNSCVVAENMAMRASNASYNSIDRRSGVCSSSWE